MPQKEHPYFEAIEAQDLEGVRDLSAQGISPNFFGGLAYWTPLQAAINELDYDGTTHMVVELINAGADPDLCSDSSPPILMALMGQHASAVQVLLDAGANPNICSIEGTAPLLWCIDNGDSAMLERLLRYLPKGTIDNAHGGFAGATPLGLAVARLELGMIQILIAAGA